MILVTLAITLLTAACGGAPATTTPYAPPPPAATPVPWALAARITYDSRARLGDTFRVVIEVTNTGRSANPASSMSVDGLDDHADLADCTPTCHLDHFLGANFATFGGVAPGGSEVFTLIFQTTKLGRIQPFVCVYDGRPGEGNRVGECGEATVVIGG